jgi:hypothetical protein
MPPDVNPLRGKSRPTAQDDGYHAHRIEQEDAHA